MPLAPKGIYPVDKVIVKINGKGTAVSRFSKIRRAVGNCMNPEKNIIIVDYNGPDGQEYCTMGRAQIVARLGRNKLRVIAPPAAKESSKNGTLFERRGKLMFEVD